MDSRHREFLDADIPSVLAKLQTEEKIALLGAPGWWSTTPIPRLGIPAIRMSDGPNGVRGASHFKSTPAICIPCATALASTFDVDLIRETGVLLGKETKAKAAVVLLAPTCNIQRSPLGGRAFESFSEDPHLSGIMCAAYINGLQSEGVSATIKHYVGNDQEHERTAAESVVSTRALREIYLYPFMLAQKLASPWAFMTSYGRINGVHCAESPELLQGVLRNEWKFNGMVVSDWFGTYGTDAAINAGLDLEMPGPSRWRTLPLVTHCLSSQKILMATLDKRVETMLKFIQQQAKRNPEVVFGDGIERTLDSPETRAFTRKLASSTIVLLKNDNQLLPFRPDTIKKILVVGPNAKGTVISGGGSAFLKASYVVTPFDGIKSGAYDSLEIDYTIGCYAHKYLPTLENNLVTPDGHPGWLCSFYNLDNQGTLSEKPVADIVLQDTRIKLNDFLPPGLNETWLLKVTGKLTFEKAATYELGLTVAGRAKLYVNGKLFIDNWTKQTPGDFFYGQGTIEEKALLDARANESLDVLLEYSPTHPPEDDTNGEGRNAQPALMRGVRLGGCEKIDSKLAIQDAVTRAGEADAVVFVAGLTPEWESEGFDRPSLQLPGLQDEAIAQIAKANPRTVVLVQDTVSMPWSSSVHGIVQTWYLGNETGNAIADVLFGKVNPSGRLPLSLPTRMCDVPAEFGKIHYREDLFVGYKGYMMKGVRAPLPFWICDLSIKSNGREDTSWSLHLEVTLKNIGDLEGSEVAQVYVTYPDAGYTTPSLQLKGFAKSSGIKAGESCKLSIQLDKYAVSSWHEPTASWVVEPGIYTVHVGFSSTELVLKEDFTISGKYFWSGI
ncbi:glycoside hydrolase family 3 protein [Flagelloscypha sp. PMI_526]|nr:glycoside hydrolase family 3 protein [Flagelloscypha sp. PMI_526]